MPVVSTNPQFLISQPRQKGHSSGTLGGVIEELEYRWEAEEIHFPTTVTKVLRLTDTSAVRDFCERVSKLLGVTAVMVEEIEDGLQHVTTFLNERSHEIEAEIYKVEAETIQKYPNATMEFHVRSVPRDSEGNPELPNGPYYLLTWQAS